MPLLRKSHQGDTVDESKEVLKDNDEVFYCELSHEIYRNYEDYFQRIMLFNSTVWVCALTSRPNLTYAEALESEKNARKILKEFVYELKAPIVYIASLTKRTGIHDMVEDVFNYLNVRYVKEESVYALEKCGEREIWRECELLNVMPPQSMSPNANVEIDSRVVLYRVKHIDRNKSTSPWVVNGTQIRRLRANLTKDRLKLFLKQCVECNDFGLLKIKPAMYQKYVIDGGVRRFSDFFVGKQPTFVLSQTLIDKINTKKEAASKKKEKSDKEKKDIKKGKKELEKQSKNDMKREKKKEMKKEMKKDVNKEVKAKKDGSDKKKDKKKALKDNKQPAISKYFSKDANSPTASTTTKDNNENKVKNNGKTLTEEMIRLRQEKERLRKEKEERDAEVKRKLAEERERQRVELQLLVQATVRNLNQIRDDLELQDQRILPAAKPVQTLIPSKFFGDVLMILEFIYSYSSILEDKDKFPKGYSLSLLERSLNAREIAGPLSDIIQVLLGTIFALEIEEENEVEVNYVTMSNFDDNKVDDNVKYATAAGHYCKQYLAMPISELPMDATTVSELLRLHLLSSGAKMDENCTRWRFQQRGGYSNEDNPGYMLRMKYPHILRALGMYTVYELPNCDVLKILHCLIGQILTYSSIRDMNEERLVNSYKAKLNLKAIIAAERKREHLLGIERKSIAENIKKKLVTFEGSAEEKLKLKEQLDKQAETKLQSLEFQSERAKTVYNNSVAAERQAIFSYQLLLGTDRAYRTYWLFESLPGVFIEHQVHGGRCYDGPVKNNHELADCSQHDRYTFIKHMVAGKTNGNNDKENKVQNNIETKVKNNGSVLSTTADVTDVVEAKPIVKEVIPASQRDLLMCTGNNETCPVHSTNEANRIQWSFLHTEDELNALINSLNTRGIREKALKETLESEKELILTHIKGCPVDSLLINNDNRQKAMNTLFEMREYTNANMNYPAGTEMSSIIKNTLIDNILDMERHVTAGHLGSLNVKDRETWRNALLNGDFSMQCDGIKWGPENQFSEGKIKMNGSNAKNVTNKIEYTDPGASLGNTEDIDPDDSQDDEICLYDSPEQGQQIHNYATALLQVTLAIDQQFFKPPFGVLKELKNPIAHEQAMRKGRDNLEMWTVSLMNATSYSQLFLHYNILNDAVKWTKSSLNAACIFCRLKSQPEKMLLCDGCNSGKHLFCFKPKLTKVPDEDWFCEKCKPKEKVAVKKKAKARKIFAIESDDEGLESDSSEDLDNSNANGPQFYKHVDDAVDSDYMVDCERCNKPGRMMLTCSECKDVLHLKCAKPPMKVMPNKKWQCDLCQRKRNKVQKRKPPSKVSAAIHDNDDEPVGRKRKRPAQLEYPKPVTRKTQKDEISDSDDDPLSPGPSRQAKQTDRKTKKTINYNDNRNDESTDDENTSNNGDVTLQNGDGNYDSEEESEEEVQKKRQVKPSKTRSRTTAESDDDDILDIPRNARDTKAFKIKTSRSRRTKSIENKKRRRITTSDSSDDDFLVAPVKYRNSGSQSKRTRKSPNGIMNDRRQSRRTVNDEEDPLLLPTKTSPSSSGVGSRRSRRVDEDDNILLDTAVCYDLLSEIAKHKYSWPFERPVKSTEVPDYYQVIETPMDFAKIKSKLNLGAYRTMYDIMNDIQLIFTNCDLYNTNGSDIYQAGVELEKFIQTRCRDLNIPFKPSDMIAGR